MFRSNQKGEGRIGLVVAIAVVGCAIFVGTQYIPVRIKAYEFRDVLRNEARMGAVRASNQTVTQRILEKAEELEIPLTRKNLKVRRTKAEMIVSATYEHPIDLKVTEYVYRFEAEERAPLF
ncbi:MAG: hypothetical protein GY716_03720 [bacterium]|nr:hypothetical protein [bacterium]